MQTSSMLSRIDPETIPAAYRSHHNRPDLRAFAQQLVTQPPTLRTCRAKANRWPGTSMGSDAPDAAPGSIIRRPAHCCRCRTAT
jgi:hypothetical protein